MEVIISPFKASRKWALYGTLFLSIVLAIVLSTGWFEFQSSEGWKYYSLLGTAFLTAVICNIGAQLFFRKHNEDLMTFGEGFSISIFMGIITAVLVGLAAFIILSITLGDEVIVSQGDGESPDIRLPIPIAFGIAGLTFFYYTFSGLFTTMFIKKG